MFRKLIVIAFALSLALPGLLLAATPVNINKADAATIAKSLDGIGKSRAEAIVAWRDAHGPFKQADDLKHVKGVGKATIERNRGAILLSEAGAVKAAEQEPAPKPVRAEAKAESED